MEDEDIKTPRNILPDCIIPALALGFAIYYLTTITEVPWISQASALIVSGLLVLSIIAFIVRSVWRVRRGEEVLRWTDSLRLLFGQLEIRYKRLAMLLLAIGFVWVIDYLGFTLSTLIFVFAGIVILSGPADWRRALIISLTCSVTGYVVFIYFFKTRFPFGPIENLLRGLT